MNDSYKELLVSKEQGVKDKLIRVVSIIPTVLAGLLALLTGNILIFMLLGYWIILFFSGHPSNMSICIWIKRLPLIRLWQRPEEKESLPLM